MFNEVVKLPAADDLPHRITDAYPDNGSILRGRRAGTGEGAVVLPWFLLRIVALLSTSSL